MPGNNQQAFNVDVITFNQLFRLHYPALRAYADLLMGNGSGEDIVQDVFLYAWENRSIIHVHSSVKAYLFKAIHNKALNYFKHRKVVQDNHQQIMHRLRLQEVIQADPEKNLVIQKLYINELRQDLEDAIDTLPDRCREVFRLSYLEDLQNKQISQLLDISVSTVEKHITHALKTLRKSLGHVRSMFMQLF